MYPDLLHTIYCSSVAGQIYVLERHDVNQLVDIFLNLFMFERVVSWSLKCLFQADIAV